MDFPVAHQRSQVKLLQMLKTKKKNLLQYIFIFLKRYFLLEQASSIFSTCQYFAFTFKTEIFAYSSQDGFQQKNFYSAEHRNGKLLSITFTNNVIELKPLGHTAKNWRDPWRKKNIKAQTPILYLNVVAKVSIYNGKS